MTCTPFSGKPDRFDHHLTTTHANARETCAEKASRASFCCGVYDFWLAWSIFGQLYNSPGQPFAYFRHQRHYQRVAHAKITHAFGHACVGPTIWEPIEPLTFLRGEHAQTAGSQVLDHMGGPPYLRFRCQHRPGRHVQRFRESNAALCEKILASIAPAPFFQLRTFRIFPPRHVIVPQKETLAHRPLL